MNEYSERDTFRKYLISLEHLKTYFGKLSEASTAEIN